MKTLLKFLMIAFLTMQGQAQEILVSGTITDESALPLPGVNIIVKGTSNGTQTDFDGNYEITAEVGQRLIFSYIGYENEEHQITSKTTQISFAMRAGSVLHEVVVTGYAATKQRKSTSYSVNKITSESIGTKKGYASENNISRTLTGRSPGIAVTYGAGLGVSNNRVMDNSYVSTDRESYAKIDENIFKMVQFAPLSTFSIDVDKAGYSNIRRMINNGQTIPQDAVKIEEMINYFSYNYSEPKKKEPFSIDTEMASSPWNKDAKLVKIGLKGKDVQTEGVPGSNLVFLIDVSGSMGSENKLGLLKPAFGVLVDQLREQDKVSIVVYAGAAGVVLPPTNGIEKNVIMDAIENLSSGGSTAGGEGIELAYKLAEENFIEKGNNRVILATDGDFNVGASSDRAMEDLIVEKRNSGVFLTVLGFGMGNYQDSKMETLADKGNGNHAYIDSMQEARKVLGKEFFGTMYTIAKDVKIQVEFNPNKVQAYRLVGYENRLLNDEDFEDDKKDAGELGSGHTVTALYEIIPVGVKSDYLKNIPDLKYTRSSSSNTSELLTVKFRYKEPDGKKSKLIVKTLMDNEREFENASQDFKFSAAVALFGMQIRKSDFVNKLNKNDVIKLAEAGRGSDKEGYRAEFIRLVKSYW